MEYINYQQNVSLPIKNKENHNMHGLYNKEIYGRTVNIPNKISLTNIFKQSPIASSEILCSATPALAEEAELPTPSFKTNFQGRRLSISRLIFELNSLG